MTETQDPCIAAAALLKALLAELGTSDVEEVADLLERMSGPVLTAAESSEATRFARSVSCPYS